MKKLIDPQGRHIHKLRLALLDACNFRCRYCMPQKPSFLSSEKLMSRKEIRRLSAILVNLGIDEIRMTGGEPSLRNDFIEIVEDLSSLPLKKLALTSNGHQLTRFLPALSKTACKYLNFSLDSLNKFGFYTMTGSHNLESVLKSIFMAKELGFEVKINVVLMRGLNSNEVEDFIDFSSRYEVEVRFLELMRIGEARDGFEKHFISAGEVIDELQKKYHLNTIEQPVDATSFNFKLDNGANIGFIASESRPFCGGCSRLRLSAEGSLRPCLMLNKGFSLLQKSRDEIQKILLTTMALKPVDRIYEVTQSMNEIGG